MYKLMLAATAVAFALIPAVSHAADLRPVVQPAPAIYLPPQPTWNGWYVGGNLGVGWFAERENSDFPQAFFPGLVAAGTSTKAGVVGGVQGGYNWQWSPNWVVGVEGDFDATSMKASAAASTNFASFSASSDVEWLASLRGRVGYLWWPNLMLYGTAGVAFADIRDRATFNSALLSAAVESNKSRSGFVVGAGAEYAWSPQWTVRAEYLFYEFNGRTETLGTIVPVNVHWDNIGINVIRLGANYKF